MKTISVAILEDNIHLLKDLKFDLESTGLIKVEVYAANSSDFLSKTSGLKIDALILDIDLGGDSMSGIDIANKLRLPVLFVSGKTPQYINEIEDLNLSSSTPVEFITKPITAYKLDKILPKFIQEIAALCIKQSIRLDFRGSKNNQIELSDIVYLETEQGQDSNNKIIYFSNRKPETLIDFSFSKMENFGLDNQQFITINRAFRVNRDLIRRFLSNTQEVEVEIMDNFGSKKMERLKVSDNYLKNVRGLK